MTNADLAAELTQALDRTMVAFKAMTDKVMSGRVTWVNIQAELTDDELVLFWACLNTGKRDAANRLGEALG